MLKTVIGVIGCVVAVLSAGAAPAQQTLFRPVAIVNDSAITAFDVTEREQLMLALGFQAPNKEALRSAAVDRLIDDRLKIQEAKRGGLVATPEAIEAGIEETAKNGQMTAEDLRALVRDAGVFDYVDKTPEQPFVAWVHYVEQALRARINAPLLEQAVANLIDNACKHSPVGATIWVEGERGSDEVIIRVRDQGCGIEEHHLPRLFERFYRVDKSRSRKLGGTGLGLAIVKHISQAHHGQINVVSAPDKGSTFWICLPMAS